MTNHAQHAKQPNPDGTALKHMLRARPVNFIAGPFYDSRRNLRSQGILLAETEDDDGNPMLVKKQLERKRGIGITRKPGSKRLPPKTIMGHMRRRDTVVSITNRGPEQRSHEKGKSLWGRIKDTAKQFFSGRQRGRG